MLRILGKSNSINKILIRAFKNKLKKKIIKLKFIIIIIYNKNEIKCFYDIKKL